MTSSGAVVSLRQLHEIDDPLAAILRGGARRVLARTVEAEAEAFLATMKDERPPNGHDRLVCHGHGPERVVQTGIGPVALRRAKLRDCGTGAGAGDAGRTVPNAELKREAAA